LRRVLLKPLLGVRYWRQATQAPSTGAIHSWCMQLKSIAAPVRAFSHSHHFSRRSRLFSIARMGRTPRSNRPSGSPSMLLEFGLPAAFTIHSVQIVDYAEMI